MDIPRDTQLGVYLNIRDLQLDNVTQNIGGSDSTFRLLLRALDFFRPGYPPSVGG